jgi:hypothetical protein
MKRVIANECCNKIISNDVNWIFISVQVHGLNVPMMHGSMAHIHESQTSLNEGSSTSQAAEQDKRRYVYSRRKLCEIELPTAVLLKVKVFGDIMRC